MTSETAHPHFIVGENKVQTGEGICPKSHG